MLEYTSREVVQAQKQYDMLLASLEYCDDSDKEDIFIELNKIEENILNATNDIYEEFYNKLANNTSTFIDEERERLTNMISLVEDRIKYLDSRKEKHKKVTNTVVEEPRILGKSELNDYKKRVEIIDKYKQNIKLKQELNKEISVLEEKERICLSKLKANDKINVELEEKMQEILSKSFNAMDLYILLERTDEVELAYKELSFAKEKAMENVETARKSSNNELIIECQNMLDSISSEYNKYFEKKMLLELLNIYDDKVENYDELLAKREKMQEIFMNIEDSDFYKLVSAEMNKQYNTIKIEEQDVKTYREIISDLEERKQKIEEIDFENNSDEFKKILEELIKNEKVRQEQILQEQRRKEYEERQRKLILENKRQEELKRRQILIDEARRKEEQRKQEEKRQEGLKRIEEEKQKELEKQKRELLELEQEEKIEPEEVHREIPISTIESKARTVYVPKEVVFDDDKNEKIEEVEKNNNRDSLFESIYDEMKKKLESEKNESKNSSINYQENVIDDIFKEVQSNETFKDKKNDFSIPVIKNDNLVAKKVKDEIIDKDNIEDYQEKINKEKQVDEDLFLNDVIFPDMPM